MLTDTIIARATPPGFGGLAIVRLSGKKALAVAGRIFEAKSGRKKPFPALRPVFGAIRDPEGGASLDEAFLTYFKAPRSYTREDVVELSVHGSPAVLEAILALGVKAGARLARPGEFTLRAYVNGRLDIIQAEAVNDLIRSVSLDQARIATRQLAGSLSRRVSRLRTRLISLQAGVEAGLEFPEEGLRTGPAAGRKTLAVLMGEIERLVASFETGRIIREGVTLAITGRTNVGKSTLFNVLLEDERAIVTPFPGTTRDYLRETILLGGTVFHLVDMAGMGAPAHPAEKRAIALGRKIAREADGLIVVLDASRRWSPEDDRLLKGFRDKRSVIVINKTDLPRRLDGKKALALAGDSPIIEISALKGQKIEALRRTLAARFAPRAQAEEEMILHERQRDRLEGVLEALRRADALIAGGHSEEMPAEEIRTALGLIGELTGEVRADEVLAEIFDRFCVGK